MIYFHLGAIFRYENYEKIKPDKKPKLYQFNRHEPDRSQPTDLDQDPDLDQDSDSNCQSRAK